MNTSRLPTQKMHPEGAVPLEEEQWLSLECAGGNFKDTRLAKRFKAVLSRLWKGMGDTIPLACED
jgi:Transposase DNA-binding